MIDLLIILYIVVNVLLGFRFGLFRRVIHILGFYVGLLLAQAVSPGASQSLGYSTGPHPAAAHFGIYLLILMVMVVVVEILGAAFGDALAAFNALVFDRFFGAAVGLIFAVLELSVVLFMFNNLLITPGPTGTGEPAAVLTAQDSVQTSLLAGVLNRARPAATFVYLPVLPSDAGRYFSKTYT